MIFVQGGVCSTVIARWTADQQVERFILHQGHDSNTTTTTATTTTTTTTTTTNLARVSPDVYLYEVELTSSTCVMSSP